MKENIEKFISDGSEIIELKEEYLGGSVKAFLINKDNTLTQIPVTEIGNKYISLTNIIEAGKEFEVRYNTVSENDKFDLYKRIQQLETKIEKQDKILKEVLTALRHRVDLGTFNTWTKSIEDKIGVELISQSFQTPYP